MIFAERKSGRFMEVIGGYRQLSAVIGGYRRLSEVIGGYRRLTGNSDTASRGINTDGHIGSAILPANGRQYERRKNITKYALKIQIFQDVVRISPTVIAECVCYMILIARM